jgi:hypothetical protein
VADEVDGADDVADEEEEEEEARKMPPPLPCLPEPFGGLLE